jgi:Na+/H+-dicarboxylate symporter
MSNQINQFFGGPPVSVVVRLVLLSILVGVILSALGLDPLNLWRTLQNLVRQIWEMGFDALWWLWRYFLIGAVLVIPIWLVLRLAKGTRGRA